MMMKPLSIAVAALLSAGTFATAQSTQSNAPKPAAYGNAYQGTAIPADEPVLTSQATEEAQAAAPAAMPPAQTMPVQSAPKPSAYASPAARQNPDAGIVEVPVPDDDAASTAPTKPQPKLRSHAFDPDAEIVTSVPLSPNQLPEGTPFHARLVEELSAETITPGTPFSAQTTRDVVHMGRVVIPVGSFIHGRITYVSAGRRIGGRSTMRLTPEEVVLPDGTHYHFRGIVTQTAGSNTKTDSEGYVINKDHAGHIAAGYGATIGGGAAVGAVVGGPIGAGVGSAIGAGVMTVNWLSQHNAAVLPANSLVTFAIRAPLALTPSAAPATQGSAAYATPAAAAPAYAEPKVQN